ncbi:unnamed protein product, partial [Didymodactylos carnosus]
RSMDNNSNSTTSMLFHLSVAHLPEYSLVKNNHSKRARRDGSLLPLNSERSLQLTRILSNFIIRDLLPISFVERSKALKELMNEVEPSYMIPTRNYFRDVVIKKQCEEVGVQLRN